jgi:hypothetical protein
MTAEKFYQDTTTGQISYFNLDTVKGKMDTSVFVEVDPESLPAVIPNQLPSASSPTH